MSALRFVFASLCLLVSLLVLFKVPDMFLWQLKVAATEYGHWLALAVLLLLIAGRRQSFVDSLTSLIAIASAVLFLSSSVRAAMIADKTKSKMDAVFPAPADAPNIPGPFSFWRLWTIGGTKPVAVETIDYQEFSGSLMSMDYYRADVSSGRTPCILLIHGGGWDKGSRKELQTASHRLARRGISVAAMDYRLAPQAIWPAQADDVRVAISVLKEQADGLSIDPKKIVLMGRSAGGQIAEAVAASGTVPDLRGCIALYAPADMHYAFKYADQKDILDSGKLLKQYLGGTPDEAKAAYDSASAYGLVSRKTVPMLLLHGANDELVWCKQSQRLAQRLTENGVKHVYLELPWATHAFDHNDNGPGGQVALWAVERFVRSVTQ
jgi:acetyl esterase/lipase